MISHTNSFTLLNTILKYLLQTVLRIGYLMKALVNYSATQDPLKVYYIVNNKISQMKKEYPTPKLFKPTREQEQRVAQKLAKHLSKDKVVVTKTGQKIRGLK